MTPKPPQLYLFRHGRTEWSAAGKHTGRSDIPLTEDGEQQARRLEPRVARLVFDHVLSSPSQRARKTAELAGLGATMQVEPDLAEWDYGDYEGLTSVEIKQQRPGWDVFRDGGPNGESPAQVADRADRLIARLETLGGRIAVFSHGHFSRVIAARWIGQPIALGLHLALGEACMSVLDHDARHAEVRVISLWNQPPD